MSWVMPQTVDQNPSRKNGHIAIDCACVAGGQLAAFCVETEDVIYVKGKA